MATRADYDLAVARLRRYGTVRETDFPGHASHPAPYRIGCVEVEIESGSTRLRTVAGDLAALAVETGAYLTLNVHKDGVCAFRLMVSRPLDAQDAQPAEGHRG